MTTPNTTQAPPSTPPNISPTSAQRVLHFESNTFDWSIHSTHENPSDWKVAYPQRPKAK